MMEEMKEQKNWEVLVSQVPTLKSLLRLAQLSNIYTVLVANQLPTDNTETAHKSSRTTEGSMLADDGGENDNLTYEQN